ncbi:hypothetical protein CesoFtcFv8_000465 [Champsocephalus esox]|uniref:Uncharacterized protein n=1 Tax=Champsocephalus esox TaxID=159716 RepID=A0AAN8D5E3_9TELE|nr:hypothetical protein CesoFtcFv8_000465 [Champsocephalus esox]
MKSLRNQSSLETPVSAHVEVSAWRCERLLSVYCSASPLPGCGPRGKHQSRSPTEEAFTSTPSWSSSSVTPLHARLAFHHFSLYANTR